MDDTLKSAALAALADLRHKITMATLQPNVDVMTAAFLEGVEWRDQQIKEQKE